MAQHTKITIDYCDIGNALEADLIDLYRVERALKKHFPPRQFVLAAMSRPGEETFSIAGEERAPFGTTPRFLERYAYAALMVSDAQVVICTMEGFDSYTPLSWNWQHHFGAVAILVERSPNWHELVGKARYEGSLKFFSHFGMPPLKGTGPNLTPDQRDRCLATVLYGVIAGWKAGSQRHGGLVSRLG